MLRRSLAGFVLLVVVLCPILALSQTPRPSAPKYRPDRILVRFRAGVADTAMKKSHQMTGGTVVRTFRTLTGLQVVKLPAKTSVPEMIRAYRKDPNVLYAEPDYSVHTLISPNDPDFTNGAQWDLNNTGQSGGTAGADIKAPAAWDITTGSSSVVVAIIDTGIDYTHPDLVGNLHQLESSCNNGIDDDGNGWIDDCYGIAPVYGTTDPFDDFGHGTHVAGTIGATGNNAIGVAGINWNVGLVSCKFLDSFGFGFLDDAITCLDYLKDLKDNHGLNLIATNNSWGGGGYSQALSDAIQGHMQSGILFFAAAGNAALDNDSNAFYPADYYLPNVIAVAATDRNDALAVFSNTGKRTVSLGAPGVDIMSTVPNGGEPISDPSGYALLSGTSMATPHVTGVAALLKAQDGTRDWIAIKNLLLAGGDNKASLANTITGKRLNALGSLTCSNSPVLARLRPLGDAPTAAVGDTLLISVLHINCAAPAGDVTVTINPGGTVLTLKDDGAAPDQVAGDGIYSANYTAGAPGVYTVSISGGETFNLRVLSPYYFQPTPFSYRTISGTSLNFSDDEVAKITPGFTVPFGGAGFNSLYVSANGTISFDSPYSSFINNMLPTPGPTTLVSPFWTDLIEPSSTQNVFWQVTGSAPNRELVIEWRGAELYPGTPGTVTFQTVFFENRSDVLFNYLDTNFDLPNPPNFQNYGGVSTVGIQVSPTSANQFSFDSPTLENGVALLWTTTGPNQTNPVPAVTTISPLTGYTTTPFNLTITGTGFQPDSFVRWGPNDVPVTYNSSTQLTAQIPSSSLQFPGFYDVTVFNFDGGVSNTLFYNLVAPIAGSVSPSSATTGAPAFPVTVTGANFASNAVVNWNGSPRSTTFTDSSHLTATINASDIVTPGFFNISVTNVNGFTSGNVTFTVNPPNIDSISPTSVTSGSGSFTLTVNGNGFLPSSYVDWMTFSKITPLTTTYVSFNQLTAVVPAALTNIPGQVQIAVFNPGPVETNVAYEMVNPPSISSVSPTSATSSGAGFTLTVNGADFLNGSTVRWGGMPRPTTYVNGGQLTADIPSSDLIIPGTIPVDVMNPGGGLSTASPYSVARGPGLRLIPVTPCRIADTRNANGPFGGPFLSGGAIARGFTIPSSTCNIPSTAQAYSLNVTVVPHGPLGYLTMFPCGQAQPFVSTLNSLDGRIKAVAAITTAGTNGSVCAFATNDTDLVLDINGYFVPSTDPTALAFFPVTPCRLVDTRNANAPLAGPQLVANQARTFPLLTSSCNIPSTAKAYSLNFTAVPQGGLGYLTTWPADQTQPFVSTLNALTGTITANAAIVPAAANGDVSVFVTNPSHLVIDVNGYFAPFTTGGLSLVPAFPCRTLDSRNQGAPPWSGQRDVNVQSGPCSLGAQAYVLNATVVPSGGLGYLTLWPQGGAQPLASTLNSLDGAITSNMAIVPAANGAVSAYASNNTHLVLDIAGYFAPEVSAPTTRATLTPPTTGATTKAPPRLQRAALIARPAKRTARSAKSS